MAHVNVFETKTTNELIVLYREYLDAEKVSGIYDTNELGKIKKMYDKDFGANAIIWLQIELTHTLADRWFKERDKLKNLIEKYDGFLEMDNDKETDEYEKGTHDDLLAVVTELKEILG